MTDRAPSKQRAGYWHGDTVRCPIAPCPYTGNRTSMYVHLQTKTHREAVGGDAVATDPKALRVILDRAEVVPAGRPKRAAAKPYHHERANQKVACPRKCGRIVSRQNLTRHLEGIHHATHAEALRLTRSAPAVNVRVESLPAVIAPEPEPAPARPVTFAAIDPTDIAVAVTQSQVNGRGLAVELLPDFVAYVDHTREYVAHLRRSLVDGGG